MDSPNEIPNESTSTEKTEKISKRGRYQLPGERVSLTKNSSFDGVIIGYTPKNKPIFEDPEIQAEKAFKWLQGELEKDPNKKIGLLYAANCRQAIEMQEANKENIKVKDSCLAGAGGQGAFFAELLLLINKHNLEKRIQVFPIATSKAGGSNKEYRDKVTKQLYPNFVTRDDLDRDINAIDNKLTQGFTVYGLPRKVGNQGEVEYRIGGDITPWFTETDTTKLPEGAKIEGTCPNVYLQVQLKRLEAKYPLAPQQLNVSQNSMFQKAPPPTDKSQPDQQNDPDLTDFHLM